MPIYLPVPDDSRVNIFVVFLLLLKVFFRHNKLMDIWRANRFTNDLHYVQIYY